MDSFNTRIHQVYPEYEKISFYVYASFPSFSLPDVLRDPTKLIWRNGTPSEEMTDHTAPLSDGLLAEVFLSCKTNAKRSVHSPQDNFIIIRIISSRHD